MKRQLGLLMTVLLLLAFVLPTAAQEESGIVVTLAPYEGNPILTADADLAWEAGGVGRQRMVAQEDVLYMFYQGYTVGQTAGSVGYATSEDGLTWTKYQGNPVFVPDESIAPQGVMTFAAALLDETWMLYFSPWPRGSQWFEFSAEIRAATAPTPDGPWTVTEEPILDSQAWDRLGSFFYAVTHDEDNLVLYYQANSSGMIGAATSADGIDWVKYDDPTTTSALFATSDPLPIVPNQDPQAWDNHGMLQPVIRKIRGGWEMFYAGADAQAGSVGIGYATSPDGVTWTRPGNAPLLSDPDYMLYPETIAEVDGVHYLYYVLISRNWQPQGIAVAEITYE